MTFLMEEPPGRITEHAAATYLEISMVNDYDYEVIGNKVRVYIGGKAKSVDEIVLPDDEGQQMEIFLMLEQAKKYRELETVAWRVQYLRDELGDIRNSSDEQYR